MADQRIQYTEQMVGNGHPTLADTLNRLSMVEHNTDGTHKAAALASAGVTASVAELNIMDGVTVTASDINTVTAKANTHNPTFTGDMLLTLAGGGGDPGAATITCNIVSASSSVETYYLTGEQLILSSVPVTATAAELNIMGGVTVTAADINTVTAKANIDNTVLTGNITATMTVADNDLFSIKDENGTGLFTVTATGTAGLRDKLTVGSLAIGATTVTSTATEINQLASSGLTNADLVKLHAVTSSATDINKLAGTPAGLTSTEIGYLDGVTSAVQTQINGKATKTQSTWGPTISFSGSSLNGFTAGDTFGRYTQIDNVVFFSFYSVITAVGSPLGNLQVSLPVSFGVPPFSSEGYLCSSFIPMTSNKNTFGRIGGPSFDKFEFYFDGNTQVTASMLTTGTIHVSGSYFV